MINRSYDKWQNKGKGGRSQPIPYSQSPSKALRLPVDFLIEFYYLSIIETIFA